MTLAQEQIEAVVRNHVTWLRNKSEGARGLHQRRHQGLQLVRVPTGLGKVRGHKRVVRQDERGRFWRRRPVHTDFRYCDLVGANLAGADMRGTKLCEADLSGANLEGADMREGALMNFGRGVGGSSASDL
jgi:uncharacterized protein YjbI with pentapeptide repeats